MMHHVANSSTGVLGSKACLGIVQAGAASTDTLPHSSHVLLFMYSYLCTTAYLLTPYTAIELIQWDCAAGSGGWCSHMHAHHAFALCPLLRSTLPTAWGPTTSATSTCTAAVTCCRCGVRGTCCCTALPWVVQQLR